MTKSIAITLALFATVAATNAETIYINGSTAYRKSTIQAIINLLGGNAVPAAQPSVWNGGLAASNANYIGSTAANWYGVTYSGHVVDIKVSFYGSLGGVQANDGGHKFPFITTGTSVADAVNATFTPPSTLDTNPPANLPVYGDFQVPNVALSDTFQATTPYNTTSLIDVTVGVVPFQWVVSKGATVHSAVSISTFSMNNHLVNAIYSKGYAPLSQLTGDPADNPIATPATGLWVFASGRDFDSGTRAIALAESGYGATTAVKQYIINSDGTGTLSPSTTINGTLHAAGDGGYDTGANLAAGLKYTAGGTVTANGIKWPDGTTGHAGKGFFIGYLSKGDAQTAINSGANGIPVGWNGAFYLNTSGTNNDNLVKSGQYTFWSYEHVLYQTPDAVAHPGASALIPDLATQILTVTGGVSGIKISDMVASRANANDGAYVAY